MQRDMGLNPIPPANDVLMGGSSVIERANEPEVGVSLKTDVQGASSVEEQWS